MTTEKEVSTINKQLSDITEVFSDAYHFIRLRDLMDRVHNDSSDSASTLRKIVYDFSKLCKYITEENKNK